MMHGILAWEAGTIRLYECKAENEAAAIFARMGDFDGVMQVLAISASTALLRGALTTKPLGGAGIKSVAKQLHLGGFDYALMECGPERRIPYAQLQTNGPLAGLWLLDLAPLVGGGNGTY